MRLYCMLLVQVCLIAIAGVAVWGRDRPKSYIFFYFLPLNRTNIIHNATTKMGIILLCVVCRTPPSKQSTSHARSSTTNCPLLTTRPQSPHTAGSHAAIVTTIILLIELFLWRAMKIDAKVMWWCLRSATRVALWPRGRGGVGRERIGS